VVGIWKRKKSEQPSTITNETLLQRLNDGQDSKERNGHSTNQTDKVAMQNNPAYSISSEYQVKMNDYSIPSDYQVKIQDNPAYSEH